MKIFYIVLSVLVLGFAVFIFFASRNYSVTKQYVIDLLGGILNDTADWGVWDNFTHIPITNDPILENIRIRCLALHQANFMDSSLKALFNERGKEQLRKILTDLEIQNS